MARQIAVIGGGPAGLRAAEIAAGNGAAVTVFEGKASVGRKLLVAGRGGLNLTKAEPWHEMVRHYSGPELPQNLWAELLHTFDADAMRGWAAGLGVETFVASSGRVYPREMKAAPLLRNWIRRLRTQGVSFAVHHRLSELGSNPRLSLEFDTPAGKTHVQPDAAILALGGASWPQTGSDGTWVRVLQQAGIAVHDMRPANCGWECGWPPAVLAEAEGKPLKNVVVTAGAESAAGELLITSYGLEGGAIYLLGRALREMTQPQIHIDLKPEQSARQLTERLARPRLRLVIAATRCWNLSPAAAAILTHSNAGMMAKTPEDLARLAKAFPIALKGPRPIDEAISSAGGIPWFELNNDLMLRRLPNVYAVGEMLDWEAPTGGYLIHGCFVTAQRAATAAAENRQV